MVPKGKVIIANLCNSDNRSDFSAVLSNNKQARIEVITTILKTEVKIKELYCSTFKKLGYENIGFMHIPDNEFLEGDFNNRLSHTDIVCFMDDHFDIVHILKHTLLWEPLQKKYFLDENFLVIGLNNGASSLAEMFVKRKGIGCGLGFIQNCIMDLEKDNSNSLKKLIYHTIINNKYLGIKIPAGTFLIVDKGCYVYCRGEKPLLIFNARSIEKSSIEKVKRGKSIYAKNLKGQILSQGIFNMHSGEYQRIS
ncbi:type 1 glutamine amidotransferase family protein [Chryseobacterium contaminans]|nr:hypothetical protein [Chryseobacterium contaminans]SHL15380.1 Cyanophycinase [Chryseobacterium contaminans]